MKFSPFIFIFSLLFSSCHSSKNIEKKKMDTVRINIASDPTTLDPRKTRSLNERILTNMLFEGLTRSGKEGKSELALAKDVLISEGGTRYIFSLKEAFWTNGDKIRPRDFVYAWQKVLNPSFFSENAYQLFCIKNAQKIKKGELAPLDLGVKELDEYTLQIDLESPVPYLLELLSFSVFFPVHENMDVEGNGWDLKKTELISCGPFSLKKWKHNDFIEVIKNNTYWDSETVALSSIYMTMVSEDTEMRMFENNELDWAGSPMSTLSFDVLKEVKEKGSLCSSPMMGTCFFRLNVEKAPFDNVHIRKAFALAVNRQEIVDHVIQGGQRIALRLVSDAKDSYFNDADKIQANVLFKKGLEELGIKKEDLPRISFLYASNQRNHLIAQAVQQDWREAFGLDIILEAIETKVYYSRIAKQDYQIASGSWLADYNDPESFLEVFKYKQASTNNTHWENSSYVEIMDLARNLPVKEREIKLVECEALLMKEMPIIPIYHLDSLYVKNKNVKEVLVSPIGNLDFKWAYIDNSN